ncbi:MAG: transketolase family protein [Candidatus Micrarchaeia archaeon]|jgi:transketolase
MVFTTHKKFDANAAGKAARDAAGEALAALGKENPNVVVLDADVSSSTKSSVFGKAFPNRFFNLGISEQDLMGTAAGLAVGGKIPFACTFAMFGIGRAWEQIRNTICRDNLNVKILLTHAGVTVGEDGSSHQALEDIAITRAIPNIKVVVPADAVSATKAVRLAAATKGPIYIRLGREKIPIIYSEQDAFEIGKANALREGRDACIIACGIMVAKSLEAAEMLEKEGLHVGVIDMHTIKPLDGQAVELAARTGAIVSVEEGTIIGGLGGAIAEALSENAKTRGAVLRRVGTKDVFGESGKPSELLEKHGLTPNAIAKEVKLLIQEKAK